jgi:hypothetical protein
MKKTGLPACTVFNFIMMKQTSFQMVMLSAFFSEKSFISITILPVIDLLYPETKQHYFSSG